MGMLRFQMHAAMMLLIGAGFEEFLRIFFEFREAVLAAKIISLPVVRVLSRSRARL
jgi:ABC-type molybdate transport system permease subunit